MSSPESELQSQDQTVSTSAPSSSAAPESAASGMKGLLRGHDYAAQVQMLAPGGAPNTQDVHAAAARGVSGAGGALPHAAQIQRSFGGYDISNVQAHSDANAASASAAMGADAYATGNDVVLGAGGQDLHTVAHEAAHVVQQRAGVQLSGGVGQVGDPYEQHADRVADAVVAGQSAEPILAEMAGSGAGGGVQQKAVQRHGGGGSSGPVRTAETPTSEIVPGGAEAVENANTPAEGEVEQKPKVAWRKVVDRGRVAWYVVLEPAAREGEAATSGDIATDMHPDEAFSLAAEPEHEAAADQFEQAVGNFAMGHSSAKGAASALATKAVAVTESYLKAMTDAGATQAQMDTSFQAILGGAGPTWAGSAAVPIPAEATNKAELAAANVARIRTVAASGNVREMVNLAVSFIYQFGETAINDINNDVVEMETFYTDAKAKVGALEAGVTDFTTTVDANIKAHQAKVAEAEASGKEAPKAWAGVVTDNSTVSAGQGSSRTKSTVSEEATQSQRKVGSLGEYAQLSENEKLVMFGESASKEQSLKEQHLAWSEGRKVWFINEADAFVQKCRAASIPLGGGISGTTGRIMETARIFNTGSAPVDVRAAAIGYLLPIRAHTLIEVMKGAEPFGAGAVGEPSYAIYDNIEPFGDLGSLHPNATFTRLVEQTRKKSGAG